MDLDFTPKKIEQIVACITNWLAGNIDESECEINLLNLHIEEHEVNWLMDTAAMACIDIETFILQAIDEWQENKNECIQYDSVCGHDTYLGLLD